MTKPPVAPVVTDEMVLKAATAYEDQMRMSFKTSTVYIEPLKAAITAALEASGELERLRAALQKLHEGLAWDWRGHPVGDLPTLREIARTALQGDAP